MSEPMSSVEIEDVLSSIRRLVSEDLRPAARTPGVAVAPRPAAPADGSKLILTPALRVVPSDGEGQAEPDLPPEAEDSPSAPVAVAAGADAIGPDDDPWQFAPTFQSIRQDAEAGGSAAESVTTLGAAMDVRRDEDEWEGEEAGFVEVDDLNGADIVAISRFGAESMAADVADAIGAAVDAPGTEMSATGDTDWMPEDDAAWDDRFDERDAEPLVVTPEISKVDPAWQAAAHGAEPVTPVDDARAWADAAEAEVLRRLSQEPDETAFSAGSGAMNDAVYDEDLLRDLVRDIIREELQGALGERITRNVRKLVRAEISRALAVRDFE